MTVITQGEEVSPASAPKNGGGPLMGTPPTPFHGERKDAEVFLKNFHKWRRVNYKHPTMTDHYQQTALILTYIYGPEVDAWVKQEELKLDMNLTTFGSVEMIWLNFKMDFKSAFKYIAQKETTLAQLEALQMQPLEIDKYIASFNQLAEEAGFNTKDKGVIEMFKKGLRVGVQIACIRRKPKPVTMQEWQEAARQEVAEYLEVQKALGKNPYKVQGIIP